MRRPTLLILALLFCQSLAEEMEVEPRRNNMISKYLDKLLDKVFEEISRTNLSIPEVDLGADVGRFFDVEGGVLGNLTKKMDGIGSWGFKLDANVTDIFVGGKYDLINLDVPMLFPFFGKGPFSIALGEVNMALEMKIKQNYTTHRFDVEIPKLEIVVRNSKFQFDNLMNDASLADFLNELISNLIPDVVTMLIPPILQLLKPVIDELTNGVVLCIKNELSTGKVEECIRDLFQKTITIAGASLHERLTAVLIEKSNNFSPALIP